MVDSIFGLNIMYFGLVWLGPAWSGPVRSGPGPAGVRPGGKKKKMRGKAAHFFGKKSIWGPIEGPQ